jgi:hypothetical protein
MQRRFVVLVAASTACSSAFAQDWDWKVAPYLWATGIDGEVALGPSVHDVDVNFGDILDVLAGAALVHVEGSDGENGVFGDLIWLAVEPEPEPALFGGETEAELDTLILEGGYVRQLERFGL